MDVAKRINIERFRWLGHVDDYRIRTNREPYELFNDMDVAKRTVPLARSCRSDG